MGNERLTDQIAFLVETDRLKHVLRRSVTGANPRRENSAEHSWHVGLFAIVLSEYARTPVDVLSVVKMLLIHDVVEIDAGDTFIYDDAARKTQEAKESAAAQRLFRLLPADLARELRGLWDEFEAGASPEARFARALDRLQPVLLNAENGGPGWRKYGVSRRQVVAVNQVIDEGAPELWAYARDLIDEAASRGELGQ